MYNWYAHIPNFLRIAMLNINNNKLHTIFLQQFHIAIKIQHTQIIFSIISINFYNHNGPLSMPIKGGQNWWGKRIENSLIFLLRVYYPGPLDSYNMDNSIGLFV